MAVHKWSMKTSNSSSHRQLACNGTYVALPLGRTSVGIWSLQSLSSKPLELVGHSKAISCVCFGSLACPPLLCSSAEDYIIVWNIKKARDAYDGGNQIRGVVIYTRPGYVEYIDFSPDDSLIAVCVDKQVLILFSECEHLDTILEGHTARVTSAKFSPHHEAVVVSISEDRTFKVWDINKNVLIYQSTIISGSPFLCLAFNYENEQIAIGSADGQIRVYDMNDGSGYRLLCQVDIEKFLQKKHQSTFESNLDDVAASTITSKPCWKTSQAVVDTQNEDDPSEAGGTILGLFYRVRPPSSRPSSGANVPAFLTHDSSVVHDLLDVPPLLIVGTTASILIVNASSYEINKVIDLQGPIPSDQCLDSPIKTVSLVGSYTFSRSHDQEEIWCLVANIFQSEAHVLSLTDVSACTQPHHGHQLTENDDMCSIQNLSISSEGDVAELASLTVLSSTPLLDSSPLRSQLIPKSKLQAKPKKSSVQKKSSILDNQALTFHSKIKSSGYTQKTSQDMFSPKTNKTKAKTTPKVGSGPRALQKCYPIDAVLPTKLKMKINVAEQPTPIHQIGFSGDGQYLACALANKCSVAFKMPLSSKSLTFTGHDNTVNCVSWSHSNQYLLTGSNDNTVKLWTKSSSEPILTFKNVNEKQKTTDTTGAAKTVKSEFFSKEIRHAQFYYMDRFILIACDKMFYLYKYLVDTSVDDIKRYQIQSHYKLVNSYQLSQGKQVSALSAVNSFYSYIILCAGSDKSLEVFDMNVGKSVRVTNDVHDRTVHIIKQNQGSAYVTHPSSAYDLFTTAAITDAIKIWDLRTNRCVKRLEGHQNRAHPCGLSFSPCGKYIATGSEDKSAYIFDIRGGTYVEKLTGHTDVVIDVDYHPVYSELATASFDGRISLYSSR